MTGHVQSRMFWAPFVGSITNSKTYKISQFSPTCFLISYGQGQLGIVVGARVGLENIDHSFLSSPKVRVIIFLKK